MAELFDHLEQMRRAGGRVALATLVSTRGTTPRKEGATMLVGEGGAVLGSVTIGGCVDARVLEEAGEVLASRQPRLITLDLGDEDAWEIGLTCGGTVDVLVQPVEVDRPGEGVARLYEAARAQTAAGRGAAMLTRLDRPDGRLLALEGGGTEGTLGDGALDARGVEAARQALAAGASRVVELGDVRAFVEVFAPPALLLVVGAGHVAMPLTTLGRVLGYRTVVVDGRPGFATRERFPGVDELRIGMPSELVREYPLTPATALVLVAHDYKYDLPVLRHVLATDAGYVGMLGSTRRGGTILRMLAEEGVSQEALRRVRVPIGLDLGARTAPEIALAILAEIQAVRGGGSGLPLREKLRQ